MEPKKKKLNILVVFKLVAVLVATLAFAAIMNLYVVQAYQVDGISMEPTLISGDRLIIWKLPKSLSRIRRSKYLPKRGEVVILNHKTLAGGTAYVKRVIALPGERIMIKDGKVSVYNSSKPQGFEPDLGTYYSPNLQPTYGEVDKVVEKDHVFVMGDNRVNGGSIDSRSDLGTIKLDDINGKLTIRIYPITKLHFY